MKTSAVAPRWLAAWLVLALTISLTPTPGFALRTTNAGQEESRVKAGLEAALQEGPQPHRVPAAAPQAGLEGPTTRRGFVRTLRNIGLGAYGGSTMAAVVAELLIGPGTAFTLPPPDILKTTPKEDEQATIVRALPVPFAPAATAPAVSADVALSYSEGNRRLHISWLKPTTPDWPERTVPLAKALFRTPVDPSAYDLIELTIVSAKHIMDLDVHLLNASGNPLGSAWGRQLGAVWPDSSKKPLQGSYRTRISISPRSQYSISGISIRAYGDGEGEGNPAVVVGVKAFRSRDFATMRDEVGAWTPVGNIPRILKWVAAGGVAGAVVGGALPAPARRGSEGTGSPAGLEEARFRAFLELRLALLRATGALAKAKSLIAEGDNRSASAQRQLAEEVVANVSEQLASLVEEPAPEGGLVHGVAEALAVLQQQIAALSNRLPEEDGQLRYELQASAHGERLATIVARLFTAQGSSVTVNSEGRGLLLSTNENVSAPWRTAHQDENKVDLFIVFFDRPSDPNASDLSILLTYGAVGSTAPVLWPRFRVTDPQGNSQLLTLTPGIWGGGSGSVRVEKGKDYTLTVLDEAEAFNSLLSGGTNVESPAGLEEGKRFPMGRRGFIRKGASAAAVAATGMTPQASSSEPQEPVSLLIPKLKEGIARWNELFDPDLGQWGITTFHYGGRVPLGTIIHRRYPEEIPDDAKETVEKLLRILNMDLLDHFISLTKAEVPLPDPLLEQFFQTVAQSNLFFGSGWHSPVRRLYELLGGESSDERRDDANLKRLAKALDLLRSAKPGWDIPSLGTIHDQIRQEEEQRSAGSVPKGFTESLDYSLEPEADRIATGFLERYHATHDNLPSWEEREAANQALHESFGAKFPLFQERLYEERRVKIFLRVPSDSRFTTQPKAYFKTRLSLSIEDIEPEFDQPHLFEVAWVEVSLPRSLFVKREPPPAPEGQGVLFQQEPPPVEPIVYRGPVVHPEFNDWGLDQFLLEGIKELSVQLGTTARLQQESLAGLEEFGPVITEAQVGSVRVPLTILSKNKTNPFPADPKLRKDPTLEAYLVDPPPMYSSTQVGEQQPGRLEQLQREVAARWPGAPPITPLSSMTAPLPYSIVIKMPKEPLPPRLTVFPHVALIDLTEDLAFAQIIQQALAQWTGRSIGEVTKVQQLDDGRLLIYV